MQNQRKRGGVTSRFLGVHFDRTRKTNQWKAEINVNKVRKLLGGFSSEVEAARVYDEAALRYFGPNAGLNTPRSEEDE